MFRILLPLLIVALLLSVAAWRWRQQRPQWATASLILAVTLWIVIAGGFWGWLGGG